MAKSWKILCVSVDYDEAATQNYGTMATSSGQQPEHGITDLLTLLACNVVSFVCSVM